MAGTDDLLTRIRSTAALLDDAALEALASKGLVRRARKDLEQAAPRLEGVEGGRLRLSVEEWRVEIAERPSDSLCNCPASGICRHILAALVYLRETGSETGLGGPASCGEEILAIGDEELRRWAGRALVRRALREIAGGLEVVCQDGAPFVARAPEWSVECRFIPGGGLAGMLCSCRSAGPCLHRVAAVLAWQSRKGRRDLATEETALAESAGAPRTREEVRASVARALSDAVGLGLSALSSSSAQRFRTLATSAHGVDLPRLERLLHGLAEEIDAFLRRDARASTGAILSRAAQVEALSTALEKPVPALVGLHRSHYHRVGELDLIGLGARVFRTPSGYAGLTVYFWDLGGERWVSWTDARPTPIAFDPVARYTAPGPWTGCEAPRLAAASRVRLLSAWRNASGRLSGRASTHMLPVGPSDPEAVRDGLRSWSELVPRVRAAFGFGLAEREAEAPLVLLWPSQWGEARYDEIHQELTVTVFDRDRLPLELALPHTPERRAALTALEEAVRRKPQSVFGVLRLRRNRLSVEPVSVVEAGRIVSLGLEAIEKPHAAEPGGSLAAEEEEEERFDDEPEKDALDFDRGALGALFSRTAAELEMLAEGGSSGYRGWLRLRERGAAARRVGLRTLARAVERVVAAGEGSSPAGERVHGIAKACVRAAYVLQLTRSVAAVEEATRAYAFPRPFEQADSSEGG